MASRTRVLFGALGGASSAIGLYFFIDSYGCKFLVLLHSVGYASLKPRVREERNLRPLYDDVQSIPYPGDKAEMEAFLQRRFSISSHRNQLGIDSAEKGSRMKRQDVQMLEKLREVDAEVDVMIGQLCESRPDVYHDQTLSQIKFAPALIDQWTPSSSSSSPSSSPSSQSPS